LLWELSHRQGAERLKAALELGRTRGKAAREAACPPGKPLWGKIAGLGSLNFVFYHSLRLVHIKFLSVFVSPAQRACWKFGAGFGSHFRPTVLGWHIGDS